MQNKTDSIEFVLLEIHTLRQIFSYATNNYYYELEKTPARFTCQPRLDLGPRWSKFVFANYGLRSQMDLCYRKNQPPEVH